MPRWRRRRDEEPADPREAGATEEQAPPEGREGDEEWPEWAYEDRRSRRRRSSRRSRSRRRRSYVEDDVSPPEGEEPVEDPEVEPGVWVSDEASAGTREDEGPAPDPSLDRPIWSSEEERRLRDLDDPGPAPEEVEPTLVARPDSGWEDLPDEDPAEEDARLYDYEASDPEPDEDASADYDERGYEEGEFDTEPDDTEPSYQPVIGDVLPGEVGPRRAALHERKRKKRRLAVAGGIALVLATILGVSALSGDDDPEDEPRDNRGAVADGREDRVETMLLYGTRESDSEQGAAWLTLLSIDASQNRGSVVYIPAHTAVEVPGRGLLPLGEAVTGGDVPLLLVATEGLLGLEIDRYLELSDRDARVLFSGLGPFEVDIPSEVSVPAGSGQTQLIFPEGPQEISGRQVERLLFVTGVDGDDVELGSRHLAFWDSLFDTYGARTEELEQAVEEAAAVLGESDRPVAQNADMIGDLAAFPEDAMVLNSLPVQQVGVGAEGELYSTNDAEIEQFVRDTIGARSFGGNETRVQILNGNGVPGIGDDVAQKLVGEGFRVILSGNARSLDYEETLIIAYERTGEALALAERAKELLGVGEVQVSGQEQGIVDLTIVVGKDFLGRT